MMKSEIKPPTGFDPNARNGATAAKPTRATTTVPAFRGFTDQGAAGGVAAPDCCALGACFDPAS
jgi:hypothetical protein